MNRRIVWAAVVSIPMAVAACSEAPVEPQQLSSALRTGECRGDYCEVHTFTFEAGAGFQLAGIDEYCARSGYPDGVLRVRGIRPRDVLALPAEGGDYVLFGRSGDAALVRRYAERGEDCATGVRTIAFDDGETWNLGRSGTGPGVPVDDRRVQRGGEGNERLKGTRRIDALLGNGGDDRLYGYEEADVLSGGAGNDRLYGYGGDDVLFDGPGDDLLVGDDGDDTYVITGGYGSRSTETIEDSAGDTRLVFVDPYLHNSDEAKFSREDDSLVLTFERAERIVFADYFRQEARLTSVLFNDGLVEGEALRALLRAAEERTPH
jgi:hypothetical protein